MHRGVLEYLVVVMHRGRLVGAVRAPEVLDGLLWIGLLYPPTDHPFTRLLTKGRLGF